MNDVCSVAELLKGADNIEIFTHVHPDGDALGSAYALSAALKKLSKNVRVTVNDTLPSDFSYIHNVENPEFTADYTVSVDVASMSLLGDFPEDRVIDLAIDHHLNNTTRSKNLYCDPTRAASGEIIFEVIGALGVELDLYMAQCLYTAIATDTGCFKFSNTTFRTFEIAAALCKYAKNGNFGYLNTPLFVTKSRRRMTLEAKVTDAMTYHFDGRVAVATVTDELLLDVGAADSETAGIEQISKIPEGVLLGITLKERNNGFKVSMRSDDRVDASLICAHFGGGGHHSAAGCFVEGDMEKVKNTILNYLEEADVL